MQKKVLIVSDDPEFVTALLQSWQRSGDTPEFEVAKIEGVGELPVSSVAVLDGPEALLRLSGEVSLAIVITGDAPLPEVADKVRRVLQIRRGAGWAEIAAALALESVRCKEALQRVEEVERRLRESERFVALGECFAGAQHGLANALTGVLGHSELVLMEKDVPDAVRERLETINAMSMTIFEILQRLSALDRELQMAERKAGRNGLQNSAGKAAS